MRPTRDRIARDTLRGAVCGAVLLGSVAVIQAHRADRLGNLVYRASGRNFNPLMATAADLVIAEVSEIVETGELDPETIGTPAVYVDRIVRCDPIDLRLEGM